MFCNIKNIVKKAKIRSSRFKLTEYTVLFPSQMPVSVKLSCLLRIMIKATFYQNILLKLEIFNNSIFKCIFENL